MGKTKTSYNFESIGLERLHREMREETEEQMSLGGTSLAGQTLLIVGFVTCVVLYPLRLPRISIFTIGIAGLPSLQQERTNELLGARGQTFHVETKTSAFMGGWTDPGSLRTPTKLGSPSCYFVLYKLLSI